MTDVTRPTDGRIRAADRRYPGCDARRPRGVGRCDRLGSDLERSNRSFHPEATFGVNAHGDRPYRRDGQGGRGRAFLFSSPCSLYGAAGDKPVGETAQFNPVTRTARIKPWPRRAWRKWPTTTSVQPICATPPYGPRRGLRADIVVNNFKGNA